jgi:anti-anti-sigma factor
MGELTPSADGSAGYEVSALPDGVTLLKLSGELDMGTLEALKPAVDQAVSEVTEKLIVDISAVSFADSSAIAMWVEWAGRVPEIELRNASALIRRIIEAMGLTTALRVS